MKKKIVSVITAGLVIFFLSGFAWVNYATKKINRDVWKLLGTTETNASYCISQSFISGYLSTFSLRDAMHININSRAGITTEILNYVKQYASSPAFQNDYKKWRNNYLQSFELVPPVTREQITAKKISETEDNIRKYEQLLNKLTDAKAKKEFEQVISMAKKQLEEYRSGKSAQIDYEVNQETTRYLERKNEMDSWIKQNPETNADLIKHRLEDFLEVTRSIDYNAVLIEKNGKKYFAKQEYEGKGSQWKMAFRAGREVTETARLFAQEWLKELK